MGEQAHGPEAALPSSGGDRRRVVVLAGPSGSGKSRLAARLNAAHGWPIFRLDDFYRDEDDPAMPRQAALGIVDWDHPDSWDGERAVGTVALVPDDRDACDAAMLAGRTLVEHAPTSRARVAMGELARRIMPERMPQPTSRRSRRRSA